MLRGKGRGQVRDLDKKTAELIKSYTKTLYKKTGAAGVIRVDYLVSGKEIYLSEVNSVPGSLAYYLFCERLIDARRFFTDLLNEALENEKKEEKLLPETGILNSVRLGGKRNKR